MKFKLYHVMIPVYIVTFVFILMINGVFSGDTSSTVNLMINVGFLFLMGALLFVSLKSFKQVANCTDELIYETSQLQEKYKNNGGKNLSSEYLKETQVFEDLELNEAFKKYQTQMKLFWTKRGFREVCDIEEYINEDLMDRIGKNFFNSAMPGTLTGLGILGTFLGLSLGLASFQGGDLLELSDNMGPLLGGMKVAFHTSVYGILFSLVFSFVYRSIMAEAYTEVTNFQKAFRQFAKPAVATEEENTAAMLVYQASMANTMKQVLEVLKSESKDQADQMGHIVNQFVKQMTATLNGDIEKLGYTFKNVTEAQSALTQNNMALSKEVEQLMKANQHLMQKMNTVLENQGYFAEELNRQKKELSAACGQMSDELSSRLYAFEKMRNLYES